MGFTAPAVHYSALATLPPECSSSKSQHSITQTTSVRVILSQILKKLLNNEQTITNELLKTSVCISETNPNNNSSGNQISIGQELPKSIPSLVEPIERLPFTEPYFSEESKKEKFPFKLSTYHKHCIRQQKYIDQKQFHHPLKQIKTSQLNSSLSSFIKGNSSNLVNYRLKNSSNQQHQIKFDNKKSDSTTTLPVSTSIENHCELKYASQKNNITPSHGIRSSYTQRLRRLQSKSKLRPILNESMTLQKPSISSSIAHRIELLKKAMHNPQLEVHDFKSEKPPSPLESSSHPLLDSIHKHTQTNNNSLKSSEMHHIHHHHIHSSSISSLEWRTYLTIIGIFSIIFLLLIELITIIF